MRHEERLMQLSSHVNACHTVKKCGRGPTHQTNDLSVEPEHGGDTGSVGKLIQPHETDMAKSIAAGVYCPCEPRQWGHQDKLITLDVCHHFALWIKDTIAHQVAKTPTRVVVHNLAGEETIAFATGVSIWNDQITSLCALNRHRALKTWARCNGSADYPNCT